MDTRPRQMPMFGGQEAYIPFFGEGYLELLTSADGDPNVEIRQALPGGQCCIDYLALVMLTEDTALCLVQSVADHCSAEAPQALLLVHSGAGLERAQQLFTGGLWYGRAGLP